MSRSLFPVLSLDRAISRWEETCTVDSPVEAHGSLRFKREDYFAPLGYGGINGAKVRQMLWLITRYLRDAPASCKRGLIYAGSVKSPQLGRVAGVAAHFGIGSLLVIPSKLESAYANKKNANVIIAANMGAEFHTAAAPYNPVLQATAKRLAKEEPYRDYLLLGYGLAVDGTDAVVEEYYRFCSEQARSIPDDVETLILPAGSCNTTLAVLYGIARFRPKALKRVLLVGVGPTRIDWFEERLRIIERVAGIELPSLFQRSYPHNPGLADKYGSKPATYHLAYHDLFATKFTDWSEMMPANWGPVHLHPSYEGKVLTYMRRNPAAFLSYTTSRRALFWIVGSEPSWAPMADNVCKRAYA